MSQYTQTGELVPVFNQVLIFPHATDPKTKVIWQGRTNILVIFFAMTSELTARGIESEFLREYLKGNRPWGTSDAYFVHHEATNPSKAYLAVNLNLLVGKPYPEKKVEEEGNLIQAWVEQYYIVLRHNGRGFMPAEVPCPPFCTNLAWDEEKWHDPKSHLYFGQPVPPPALGYPQPQPYHPPSLTFSQPVPSAPSGSYQAQGPVSYTTHAAPAMSNNPFTRMLQNSLYSATQPAAPGFSEPATQPAAPGFSEPATQPSSHQKPNKKNWRTDKKWGKKT